MLCTSPRYTFHHVVLCGEFVPISCVLIQVVKFLSTAFLASEYGPAAVIVCEADFGMINHLEQKRMNFFILTFYNDCMVSIRYKRSSQIKRCKTNSWICCLKWVCIHYRKISTTAKC